MKKVLSIILVVMLVISQAIVPVFAQDEYVDPYEGAKIKSLSVVAGADLIQNYDGYWETCECDGGEYFYYDVTYAFPTFTVVYEDGREEYGEDILLTGDVQYVDDQAENHWDVGTHKVTAVYRGVECSFNVEVVETPVANVTGVAGKALREYWDVYEEIGEDADGNDVYYDWYDVSDAEIEFTVIMKDGTIYEGTDEEIYEQTGCFVFSIEDQLANPFVIGKNEVPFDFMGYEFTCEVEVVPNPYKAIEISGENELFLTFVGNDEKDTYTTRIVDIYTLEPFAGYFNFDFVTEDGQYFSGVYNYKYDNELGMRLNQEVSIELAGYESNVLPVNNWLLARVMMESAVHYSNLYASVCNSLYDTTFKGYDSQAEKLDIDAIVAISVFMCDGNLASQDEDFLYHEVALEDVEACIYVAFGLENVDITASKFYDSQTNMVIIDEPRYTSSYYDSQLMTYADGNWTTCADLYDFDIADDKVGELEVSWGEGGYITNITYVDMIPKLGDADGDFKVTSVDARVILQYVAGLRTADEVNFEYMDVDCDGDIDAVDARWVLQMVAGLR